MIRTQNHCLGNDLCHKGIKQFFQVIRFEPGRKIILLPV